MSLRYPDATVVLAHVVNIDEVVVRTHSKVQAVGAVFQVVDRLVPLLLCVDCVQGVCTQNHEATARKADRNLRTIRVVSYRPPLGPQGAIHDHATAGDVPHPDSHVVAGSHKLVLHGVSGQSMDGPVGMSLQEQVIAVGGCIHFEDVASPGPKEELRAQEV